jgi:hypothetical protein
MTLVIGSAVSSAGPVVVTGIDPNPTGPLSEPYLGASLVGCELKTLSHCYGKSACTLATLALLFMYRSLHQLRKW